MTNKENQVECRTMRVEECAGLLGIGKSSMYEMVHEALTNNGQPFAVVELKGKLLVSRKSFYSFLESLSL